jgi:predicted aldo/keto reductase-like oxidoreductase
MSHSLLARLRELSRRRFLHQAGVLGGAAFLPGKLPSIARAQDSAVATADTTSTLPRRILGRTKEQVSTLALGTWPCGRSADVDTAGVARIVNEALELGITFIDTARNYGKAEEGIGQALGSRRNQVFLTTKVWADTAREARQSLEESLRALKTDHLDLVYLHSVGNRDAGRVLADDGALTYLLQQKEAGTIRFVGISGHSRVETFVPIVETGLIDVMMVAMNFVDRHIYGFEEKVLPVANRLGVGVACMKVFGGIRGGFGAADGPNPGPQLNPAYIQQAIRYALGLPGVATLVIGPHTVDQLRQNARLVSNYRPLTDAEQESLTRLGRQLATKWGEHYGPVA